MNWLQKTINFYINASIHVAWAILSLVKITAITYQIHVSLFYYLVVFFGAIWTYNLLKYYTFICPKKTLSIGLILTTLLAFILSILFYYKLEVIEQIGLFLAGIIVFVYPLLRKIGWLKLFVVAFVVNYVTLIIPLFYFNKLDFIFSIQRFLLLFALLVPFEILDSRTDNKNMRTLPQRFGIGKTKILGYFAVLSCVILDFYLSSNFYTNFFFWVAFFISIITIVTIYFASTQKSNYYTSFWVESLPIVWWLILIVCQ